MKYFTVSTCRIKSNYVLICLCGGTESLVTEANWINSDDKRIMSIGEMVADKGKIKNPGELQSRFPS